MEPSDIPEENLKKARLMKAELLFQTNQSTIVQEVKDNHNMDLDITLIITKNQGFKIKLCLRHCETLDMLHTVRCVSPSQNLLYEVRQILQEEVAELRRQMDVMTNGIAFACWYCGNGGGHTD